MIGAVVGVVFLAIVAVIVVAVSASSNSSGVQQDRRFKCPDSIVRADPDGHWRSQCGLHATDYQRKPICLAGPVGTSFQVTRIESGNVSSVTLIKVIDPAKGADEFNTPDNGKRFVGAEFRIKDLSGTTDDDANSNAVAQGSNSQTYTADFSDIAGCTNFNDGEYNVTAGQSVVGCVVFQVPKGVKTSAIQWAPDSIFLRAQPPGICSSSWLVPYSGATRCSIRRSGMSQIKAAPT